MIKQIDQEEFNQTQRFLMIFDKIDLDGDGMINLKEIGKFRK